MHALIKPPLVNPDCKPAHNGPTTAGQRQQTNPNTVTCMLLLSAGTRVVSRCRHEDEALLCHSQPAANHMTAGSLAYCTLTNFDLCKFNANSAGTTHTTLSMLCAVIRSICYRRRQQNKHSQVGSAAKHHPSISVVAAGVVGRSHTHG
jgi:hypothetical protein